MAKDHRHPDKCIQGFTTVNSCFAGLYESLSCLPSEMRKFSRSPTVGAAAGRHDVSLAAPKPIQQHFG